VDLIDATHLSVEELAEFRAQLRAREQQLLSELQAGRQRSESDTFEQVAGEAPDAGDASVADNVTDGVSAERQRDFEELQDVQAALARIDEGSYGICLICGEPIDVRRLRAFPTARYDLQHQEQIERQSGAPSTPTL
jgi:RNA polymerase-binding transcription factor DksA